MNTYREEGPTPWGHVSVSVSNHMQAHLLRKCRTHRTTIGPLVWAAIRDAFPGLPPRAKLDHIWKGAPGRLVLTLKVKQHEAENIRDKAEAMGEDTDALIKRALITRYGNGQGKAKHRNGYTGNLFQ